MGREVLGCVVDGGNRGRDRFDPLSPVHTSNNVEATFDFVERTKFQRKTRSTLLPFSQKNRTLLRHCCQKRQQCRSNIRHCSIRQCCFDIVAGVDRALVSRPCSTCCSQLIVWVSPARAALPLARLSPGYRPVRTRSLLPKQGVALTWCNTTGRPRAAPWWVTLHNYAPRYRRQTPTDTSDRLSGPLTTYSKPLNTNHRWKIVLMCLKI